MMSTIKDEQTIGKAQYGRSQNIIQEVQECVDLLIAKIQMRQGQGQCNGDSIPWPLPYITQS